ncbi:MAG: biopolymer transporter ExbD [Gammaproteobacteria bacterium]|nr:biopolymer transporter ExbD [Gammaproteobacteria bacterium]NND40420.1 biopolymer transporter ExbD [Pseudomonadales bacterium]MBT8150292.1 biopolymer transporter ExbD [Gammaproteobacteria bacterium]NNL12009.1 biopolymer transporter ExbD [Pseudomonadales bacterium]NNM12357.1 biopolymer transporter ExbD [Pseudomonadales bacterium]
MQFKRQRRQDIDVNLTPLIDVVFLLLIFFMVSTSFVKESHLTLNLPRATNSQSSDGRTGSLEVVIDQNGFYRIADKSLIDDSVATLSSALRNLSGENYQQPLTITADAGAPYQAVVRVIDIGGKLGFSQVNITTQDEDAE